MHFPNFDVASDALATVRDILLTDRAIAAQFLQTEYTAVFRGEPPSNISNSTITNNNNSVTCNRYNKMLQSKNYITRRMSLKLLGEILLDRTNFGVMMKYIWSVENLTIVMVLLNDPSGNIQFEAWSKSIILSPLT